MTEAPKNLHQVWSYLVANNQTEAANIVAAAENKLLAYERVIKNVDYELDRVKKIIFEGKEQLG